MPKKWLFHVSTSLPNSPHATLYAIHGGKYLQREFLGKSNLHKELSSFERRRWELLQSHSKNGG